MPIMPSGAFEVEWMAKSRIEWLRVRAGVYAKAEKERGLPPIRSKQYRDEADQLERDLKEVMQ